MNMNAFFNTLLSTENAVLPSPTAMRVALPLVWAIVLGSGILLMAGKLARPYRLGLSFMVMAWTLVPGSASPAYWLGLAFQTPSLTSAVICLTWFLSCARREAEPGIPMAPPLARRLTMLGATGVVLGWVLLLDTLAWLPVSVYAWGFGSATLGAVAVVATLLWVLSDTAGANRRVPGLVGPVLMLCVLILFVLTRLPTGNLWDALIDPWLWVALQVGWLISAVRRWRTTTRSLPATRA
jgi:hypothetical protein